MDTYRERLTAPASWWVVVIAFGLIWGWLMFVATNVPIAIGAAVLATVLAGSLVWSFGSIVVVAGPEGLRVGSAHLSPDDIGEVMALDPRGFRERLGPKADARAWMRTRPYIDAGVLVGVADASDPAPYWLVSSRHPEAIVQALGQTGRAMRSNGEVHGGEEEEV
ncbi:DUF3093 domain-containing protein [Aeromicrobium sp.]|uniref:DUF3093 domain-containing protein n=1 Tax=Aeromicrobium sp. TaxID=1871063 RepID=UPI003D6A3EB4